MDLRISELPSLLQEDLDGVDRLAVADLSASETKQIKTVDLVEEVLVRILDDGTIPGSKIVTDSVTALQIAPDAVGTSELANGAVDTAALANAAVTGDKIASETIKAVNIAPNAIGSSELANGAVDTAALLAQAVTGDKIAASTITAANVAPNSIGSSELANGAVDTLALLDLSVTNAKLVGDITADKLAGGITYDKLSITSGEIPGTCIAPETLNSVQIANLTGTKIDDDSLPASAVDPNSFDRGLDKTSGLIGHTNAITSGTRNGITFDAQGHIVSHAALASTDLPVATAAAVGAVQVPSGAGLQVSGTGALSHSNSVTASSRNGITYDAQGHVVSTAALVASDLPAATASALGAVRVPNLPLTIVNGDLGHADSGVTAGSYTRVQVDQTGHVIQGSNLLPSDIPGLDASAIISGQFGSERLALNSVTAEQLADYGIAQVSQTRPKPQFAGQWWCNPVDRSAYIWIGTVDGPDSVQNGYWMNLGYGSAVEQNARFGGTYDAVNNVVESISTYGNMAGVIVGNSLPAPAQANAGLYMVVTQAGTGETPAPVEPLAVGDWVFSLGTGTNWIKVGVISGQAGVVRDDDVLVEGSTFTPAMPNVASQLGANELLWQYAQPASGVMRGTVMPSEEVLVASDGVMSIGTIDEGEFA